MPGGEPFEDLAVLGPVEPGQGLDEPSIEQHQVAVDVREDAVHSASTSKPRPTALARS
jgi:hypothetical protein